jgi:tRNA-dihydrouridine synthase
LDFIIVHARTAGQAYDGEIDLDALKEIKENTNISLVGNGNICCRKDAKEMLKSVML